MDAEMLKKISKPVYFVPTNTADIYLYSREDQLLIEIRIISNQELCDKIMNEFKSVYHGYNFRYYLDILERCKWLLLKGYNNFDDIKKYINSGADTLL